jgi:general nucleoside transport system ATP-binding protein
VSAPPLELLAITKRFGDVTALSGATLVVRAGSVHALLGENGAGKTTLVRVAFGMLRPDTGTLRVDGADRHLGSPAEAMAAGIGMVHQHFTLVPAMTVAENVALGGTGRYDARAAAARVREIGEATGLRVDPAARVGGLSVGAQERVEIVKALARGARVLILDEPTAVLAPAEAEELLRWVRAFAASGRSAVLITHKLREALAVADDVTVLRGGVTVASLPAAAASEETVARLMLGTAEGGGEGEGAGPPAGAARAELGEARRDAPDETRGRAGGPVVIRARDVSLADERGVVRVRAASCEIRAGEIVGVAGVDGSGQRELLRAFAGRLRPAAGTLEVPADVGFVPVDRHRDALVLTFALYENVALRGAHRRRGLLPRAALRVQTAALMAAHDVRAPGPDVAARALSGGNQQKLVLGRELAGAPPALVVESPTRGLDIRAAAAVHARLREARRAGAAVVVYSPDVDEVLALADRVLVVYAGTVRELAPDREAVGRAILGLGGLDT